MSHASGRIAIALFGALAGSAACAGSSSTGDATGTGGLEAVAGSLGAAGAGGKDGSGGSSGASSGGAGPGLGGTADSGSGGRAASGNAGAAATGGSSGGAGGFGGGKGGTAGGAGAATWPTCDGVGVALGRIACRDDLVCMAPGTACFLPGDRHPCGVPCQPERSCESDQDCDDTLICTEYVGDCCSPSDPASSSCTAGCTAESCPGGTTCGADGRCEPLDCQPGDCDENMDCDAGTRRCVPRRCAVDGDCDCGVCGRGVCVPGPGYCDYTTAG